MIEATCSACGTVNRIAEADVPAGAKFVTCTSCKARVAVAAKPAAGPPKLPPLPKGPPPVPVPTTAGGKSDIIDLADLPVPKRQSALGATDAASKPAPKSGLAAAAAADGELPAPRARRPSGLEAAIGGSTDLPAPKGGRGSTKGDAFEDLPAPKAANPFADLPAPKAATNSAGRALTDMSDGDDLLAPRGRAAPADLPAPKRPAGVSDLPAPKAANAFADLPAPKGPAAVPDLPGPKSAPAAAKPPPAAAKPASDPFDLPAPKPAIDLPAPKGFFDDLPQPAKKAPAAPGEVAPKGFFDDLPQPAKGGGASPPAPAAPGTDVAPKGFFDDLPQPSKGGGASPPAPAPGNAVAPKGFFDDLPQPAAKIAAASEALEQLELGDEPAPLDLGASPPRPPAVPPPPAPAPAASSSFDDLDLSKPSTGSAKAVAPADEASSAAIKIGTPKKAAGGATVATIKPPPTPISAKSGDISLELEEPRDKPDVASIPRLGPKQKEESKISEALLAEQRRKRRKIAMIAAAALALAGAGGFVFYQRHAAAQERADKIAEAVAKARKAMAADDDAHWQRATAAAQQVLDIDGKHGEALGILAEASIAGAIADGKNMTGRIAKGRKLIADALGAGVVHPTLERAQALATITANPTAAPPRLEGMIAKAPKDAMLAVYLGWAYAAAGDPQKAIAAYDKAVTAAPGVKVLALLGRARAKLAAGDHEGARADFAAVLEVQKDNVAAQVGLASALPATQMQQQESDLLAILARKDIGAADPRAVLQAWALTADIARKSGRLDAARERYRKALAVDDKNVDAMTGLAEVELRDGKLEATAEIVGKALVLDKENVRAQLVQAELATRKRDINDASARIDALSKRSLSALESAQLHVVRGKLFELQKKDTAALEEFLEAAKAAGALDLAPTMLAVNKLSQLAKAESDPAKAEALRARAKELLATLAEAAEKDPQLAAALANAYFQAGGAAEAEPWARKVAEGRPEDADAQYQLGRILRSLGRGDEAVQLLEKASQLAPERAEIGLELARTLELLKRDDEAAKMYERLLSVAEPSLELRGHAGAFYVRTKQMAKAGEQGKKILEQDRRNPDGLYLRGEGQLADGLLDEARRSFVAAVDGERTARNLDALGRAYESIAMLKGKDRFESIDQAMRAYQSALELEPTKFTSLLGLGRLQIERRDLDPAIKTLLEAERVHSNDPDVAYHLGVAYREQGTKKTKEAAVQWLQRSLALRRSADTANVLGLLYMDRDINKDRGAIEAFATATQIALDEEKKTGKKYAWYAEALYNLGNLTNQLGEEKRACEAWWKYLGENPTPSARTGEVQRFLDTSLRYACTH